VIKRLRGEIVKVGPESVWLEVAGLTYEIMLPPPVRDGMHDRGLGTEVELYTYYYMQTDGNRVTPYLLGFQNETQRELFEHLLEVPRMGPLSALRAFSLPVGELARAVESEDEGVLKQLPGVGKQLARSIIASLQGKLTRFMSEEELETAVPLTEPQTELEEEALAVLVQLGLSHNEALRSLRQITAAHPEVTSTDALVRLVFQQR
jgi:Holliday junction DNA helicase RuvA